MVKVDNADWLKTAAIAMVAVGHYGYFFMQDADWWSVFGRMAAPVFFFLMGYAQSRTIPFRWIWLGVILTLLDSWNNQWTWMAPNILLGMVLIRIARPHVKTLIQRNGWFAFVILVCVLFVMLPMAANIVDYGAVGPVRFMSTYVRRWQKCYWRWRYCAIPGGVFNFSGTVCGPDALTRMHRRRSRVPLAGTTGILILTDSVNHCHYQHRLFVHWPLFVRTRPESHSAAATHSENLTLHRLAHS